MVLVRPVTKIAGAEIITAETYIVAAISLPDSISKTRKKIFIDGQSVVRSEA